MNVDPLMEKYPGWSPYNYTLLNPVKFVNPDGRRVNVRNNFLLVDNKGIELKGGIAETEGMELDKVGKGEAGSSFLKIEGTVHAGNKEYSAEGSLFGKKAGEKKRYVVDGSLETNEKEKAVEGVYNFSFQAVFGASFTIDTNIFHQEISKAEKENNERKTE